MCGFTRMQLWYLFMGCVFVIDVHFPILPTCLLMLCFVFQADFAGSGHCFPWCQNCKMVSAFTFLSGNVDLAFIPSNLCNPLFRVSSGVPWLHKWRQWSKWPVLWLWQFWWTSGKWANLQTGSLPALPHYILSKRWSEHWQSLEASSSPALKSTVPCSF